MGVRSAWFDDLELAVQPVSASQARDFVRHHLMTRGLAHLIDDVTLVVSELATNAMVHAQTPCKVSLQAFEQTLLLKVEDGSRTVPVQVASQVLDTSRAWGAKAHPDGGKTVWAEFDLP